MRRKPRKQVLGKANGRYAQFTMPARAPSLRILWGPNYRCSPLVVRQRASSRLKQPLCLVRSDHPSFARIGGNFEDTIPIHSRLPQPPSLRPFVRAAANATLKETSFPFLHVPFMFYHRRSNRITPILASTPPPLPSIHATKSIPSPNSAPCRCATGMTAGRPIGSSNLSRRSPRVGVSRRRRAASA